ncbi:sensor histidine kinase [Geotoga petraea]|uniref:histidine kinase n=1 Tax=Geotoga petraea TaxID=28234 RepID=A0A1G6JJD5_9BACT|nr:ATP-binding protein [Geotoga petraea]MDK2945379.1 two-component system, OmpR family, phosphate regulon sensor histidine kinase PhoR [Geotoga sp.]TGG88236.1 GHKL domain-containing protein [Geotoga petraea]SDC18777.1 two-component system, OmpR family, phosphate regulon sensor histidine kinase PhoR [Geotoga petraea]
MIIYTILTIVLIILTLAFIYYYFSMRNIKGNYKKLKKEISKTVQVNINNPSDDFLLHQLNNTIKKLKNNYESEKNRRRNIYSILDSLNEGVILVSLYEGDLIKVDFANTSSRKIFTIEDYIGRSLAEIVDSHNLIDLILKSYKRNEELQEEILFYSPEKRYYNCTVKSPSIDEKYKIIILTDITREKNFESLRKEFFTIMSHELRTPLTVINGYVENLLMDESIDKYYKKMLNIIEDETARLTRLVNDLLDLGRLEKNINTEMSMEKVNISNIATKSYNFFSMLANEMDINLISEIEEDIYIKANDDRILQVIYNLLDNALKFTSLKKSTKKNVWIRLYQEKNEEKNEVVLEIEDDGIGIPSKEIQKIYDMFYRVDKSRTRQIGGFGLGLYIVKTILDKHNARIYLESEENNGTLFKINFKGGNANESV